MWVGAVPLTLLLFTLLQWTHDSLALATIRKMTEIINRLEQLLKSGLEYISKSSESELTQKPNPEKWSKKEIIGHLIDSGINNLQRFTEIQFENKPYKIRINCFRET